MADKEELVDVLDDLGNRTGEVLPKSVVHERSLHHAGAHVWMYNQRGEVLLQHRSPDKEINPGHWGISAAGHVMAGEQPEQAAVRELEEELGLKMTPDDLEYIGVTPANLSMRGGRWRHRPFDTNYLLKCDQPVSVFKFLDNEVTEVRWLPLAEYEAAVADPQRRINEFGNHDHYVYELAITEIKRRLNDD